MGRRMSAELLCRHFGFVFWVEETLARHCQQFHLEEEKKLLEKESILMDKSVARKRKRRAAKDRSRGTVIEHFSSASNMVAKMEEEVKQDQVYTELFIDFIRRML